MAKNAKYYAKISGTWEQQYLETSAGQTAFTAPASGLLNGKATVQAALDHINTKFGAANGFATLDADIKIPVSQLPASIIGGMRFKGALALSAGKTIDDVFNVINEVGEYLVVTSTGVLTDGITYTGVIQAPGDEGDFDISDGITLEAGDWIVLTEDSNSGSQEYGFAIINNTYQDATSGVKGIVQLSNYADGEGWAELTSGVNVVTETILAAALADNFGTTAGTVAEGNHTHSIYLQKAGGTMTGDLIIGNGLTGDNLIINAIDEDAAIGSTSNAISFKHLPNAGTLTTRSLRANEDGLLTYDSNILLHQNNWDTYVPEIFVSTSTPSGGKNGDVWIEYIA
jgi:hypothetical protein